MEVFVYSKCKDIIKLWFENNLIYTLRGEIHFACMCLLLFCISWHFAPRNSSGLLGNLCSGLDCVLPLDFILLISSQCSLPHFSNLATFVVTVRIKVL